MIMDVLRGGNTVPCRPWIGSDDTIQVKWYPAAPDAQIFPGPHKFGSQYWDPDWFINFQGPGMVPVRFFGELKITTPATGQHFEGPIQWFQEGIPLAEKGKEFPSDPNCGFPRLFGRGGAAIDSAAGLVAGHQVAAIGGSACDGSATSSTPRRLFGRGGAAIDSAAGLVAGHQVAAIGGLACDGSATSSTPRRLFGRGGAGCAGSGYFATSFGLLATGGTAIDSSATSSTPRRLFGRGGAAIDSAAGLYAGRYVFAFGGAAIDSAADLVAGRQLISYGGAGCIPWAVTAGPPSWLMWGGSTHDGSALLYAGTQLLATGGAAIDSGAKSIVGPQLLATGGCACDSTRGEIVTLLEDWFVDTPNTPLTTHVMDVGPGWSVAGAIFKINNLNVNVPVGSGIVAAFADAGTANCKLRATLLPGSNSAGILFRYASLTNQWWVECDKNASAFKILEYNSGSPTIRASTTQAFDATSMYEVTVDLNADTITCTLQGHSTISYHPATFQQGATLVGLWGFMGSGCQWHHFVAETR
jgi:hypothetical protein